MGPRSIEGAEKGLGRELFSILLEHVSTGEIVGMGRIVGDGGTVFHVCDMAVLPEYQRMGAGSLIMSEIMSFIESKEKSLKNEKFPKILNGRKFQFFMSSEENRTPRIRFLG